MSVQAPRRKPGKLMVETTCVALCQTTRKLLCDERIFPKRSRWLGAKDISDAASKMMMCIFAANDIRPKTAEDARERHRLQFLALGYFGALEKRMTFEAFYWEKDPNLYTVWADQMNAEEKLLKNWVYKDEIRYAELLGIKKAQED